MKMLKVICTLFIFGFVSVSHASVIFITENDINGNFISLLGADNVEVNGSFYNVRFLDGTCIALFNGCDASEDFLFGTLEDAQAASESLLTQIFPDESVFGFYPELTYGCSYLGVCKVYTVYSVTRYDAVQATFAGISHIAHNTVFVSSYLEWDDDTSVDGTRVFAVWSRPVEASAPGTAMVLLMGIAGLIVSQRRKQA
jgi:hypothetical protein